MANITAYIDGIKTPFIGMSSLPDRESNQTFSITLAGKNIFPSTNQGQVYVELYKNDTELLAIGRLISEVENLGIRPKTIINCVDQTALIDYLPITKRYQGTLQFVLEQILVDGGSNGFFSAISFKIDPGLLTFPIDTEVDGFPSQALAQVLNLTGKPLKYRCKLNERLLQIFQLGYESRLAPIPEIDVDLWTNKQKYYKISDLVEEKINPEFSVIWVEGMNYKNRPPGVGTSKEQYRSSGSVKGQNNYPLLDVAYELKQLRITTPDAGDPCVNIPYTQDGAEEVFSTTPLTELVTFPALAGIKDTIPADTTGSFDHLADFTLDLSDPALVGHPLKLYLYYGITGHETSGVTVTVQVKASPGAPEAIFSDGLTALSGDFPTAFDPETYIIQSLNTDPGEELWLPISPIDISAYIGNPDLFIRLTIAGIVETAGDRNTIAGAFFRTDCIPDCPSFVDLISLISSSGSINLIDTDEIIVEGAVAGDDNPGVSASATYEIDLTHANFEGHSINFAYTYNLFFTSSDTNTTVEYSNTVTANGDSLLDFTDTDTIVAPANSEREDTVNLDLTDYIGTIVTIVISVNNTFSPSADGAEASFAISGILSC